MAKPASDRKTPSETTTGASREKKRHLYLMRHGKSRKAKKKQKDALRSLGRRGRKDVKKIRDLMREKHVSPDLVLCSPSVRTMETLEKLRKAFDPTQVVFVDALYRADAEEMMDILRRTAADKHEVLVIGHNPALADFLPMVCGAAVEQNEAHNHGIDEGFPTAALACLEIGGDWNLLGVEPVRLMNFIYSADL